MGEVAYAGTGYEHVTKVVRPQSSLTLRSTVLKWYEIAPADEPVPLVVRALARRNLRDASKDGSLGISGDFGFVILHRCGEDFYFLLVSTWQNENELWETVWAKDARGVLLQPVADRGGRIARPSACGSSAPSATSGRRGASTCAPRATRRRRGPTSGRGTRARSDRSLVARASSEPDDLVHAGEALRRDA